MSHGPSRGIAAAVIASLSLSFFLPSTPNAAGRQLVQAPGRPYVDCVSAPERLARMERGMGEQQEALRRAEAHLRQAESGNAEATKETEDAILDKAQDWAMSKLTLAKKVRALKELGLSPEKRRRFLELLGDVEESLEKITDIKDDIDDAKKKIEALTALRENGVNLQNLATFLDESGMSDDAATAAAGALLGPAGLGIVEGFIFARDMAFTGVKQVLSDAELAQARQSYESLKQAVDLNRERIDILRELSSKYCTQPPQMQPQQSPRPIPPQDPPAPPPSPAPAPAPAVKKGGGAGKAVGLVLGLGAVGVGGYYISQALATLQEVDDGTGSGGGTPRFVRIARSFVCSGSRCSGDVEIDFPLTITSGSIIIFSSPGSFAGQKLVSPTSRAGVQTITLDRSYNLCYGTQTGLAIWEAANANGPNNWALNVSIPVSCQ